MKPSYCRLRTTELFVEGVQKHATSVDVQNQNVSGSATSLARAALPLGLNAHFLPVWFKGPSRKRGPAKGYLSDLEMKLHQMEALIGVLLASNDPRAVSLVADISQDSAARDILQRVDSSAVGTRQLSQEPTNARSGSASVGKRIATELADSTQEWQRHLGMIITNRGLGQTTDASVAAGQHGYSPHSKSTIFPGLQALNPMVLNAAGSDSRSSSPSRRRRLEPLTPLTANSPGATGSNASVILSGRGTPELSDPEDLHDALGQLSLDDASQIRYHGKASGLHLLGQTERVDRRAEGGIWRFPPARVWPPTEKPIEKARALFASDFGIQLPTLEQQRYLLDVFFNCINPTFPLFDREAFMQAWSLGIDESTEAPPVPTFIPSRLPIPLMLVIFSIAMRLTFDINSDAAEGTMSSTGDEYLSAAKYMMTANPYAASRPATCQAYLLIAYREIGIGAMSQAWLFLGVAIRMAQDLGLHRSVDKFHTIAANLFAAQEKEARNRVWWCCVVLDRYVSTYIGRPCMIFERDYDTPLPIETSSEADEIWTSPRLPPGDHSQHQLEHFYRPTQSHSIACLGAASRLSSILGQIVESLYSVKQVVPSRHHEASRIEEALEALYLELPTYLKVDLSSGIPRNLPPPHIVVLNMQYWNAILLLHRPFILKRTNIRRDSPDAVNSPADSDVLRASASRALDLCKVAAMNVSNAAIMHVFLLNQQPDNVSECVGHLQECMETLRGISSLWPAAGRGWELINGCRATIRRPTPVRHLAMTNKKSYDDIAQAYRNTAQRRVLSHAKSLSHFGRHHNVSPPSSQPESTVGYDLGTSAHTLSSFRPQTNPPSAGPSTPQYGSWPTGDSNMLPPSFSQISPTHARSASVGSHRDQQAPTAMPHFWSDPFTDSSLLTSNYYGLQGMGRQIQMALDQNPNTQYGQVNYTPFEGTGF
ncbi:SubName: Full=Uncharacterized protein {ECO:0000313/EMBL:CCA69624.1} [Serendipita indica DSM 11827]|nr:SubName: Full=Uncharacterized protein {ECO:0000313/EMBL:CCA69624.1} [Serendipita indica DSM 11827]